MSLQNRCKTLLLCLGLALPALAEATPPAPAPVLVAVEAATPKITGYRLPPDKLKRAEGLYRTRTVLFVVGSVYGILALLLVLRLRIGARFRTLAEAASRRRFVQALVFVPMLILALDLLTLPLGLYGQHLQLAYGLSVQHWGSWFGDWAKGELIGIILSTLLIWGLYAILRRSPKCWWFYGWLAMVPVIVFMLFIAPVVIDPLFNKFDSLEARRPLLVEQIERVVARGGMTIPRARMYEMAASEKVTTYNAYVTGIGASKRVVVWDNTSKELGIPQTLFIFGHEMGHYVLNHVWKGVGLIVLGLLAGLYVAYLSLGGILGRWGAAWGIRDLTDWASLPAFFLVFSLFGFLTQPLSSSLSRYFEHQADIYGLEVIHGLVPDSSQAAAMAFQKLGEKAYSYPDPNPFFVLWTYDHPPVADRTRFALDYRPWDEGRTTEFVK
ncbi:MAG TPA: M48 family metallopeptidase [Geothrix sp.]